MTKTQRVVIFKHVLGKRDLLHFERVKHKFHKGGKVKMKKQHGYTR